MGKAQQNPVVVDAIRRAKVVLRILKSKDVSVQMKHDAFLEWASAMNAARGRGLDPVAVERVMARVKSGASIGDLKAALVLAIADMGG